MNRLTSGYRVLGLAHLVVCQLPQQALLSADRVLHWAPLALVRLSAQEPELERWSPRVQVQEH